jgi:hypothetical protein
LIFIQFLDQKGIQSPFVDSRENKADILKNKIQNRKLRERWKMFKTDKETNWVHSAVHENMPKSIKKKSEQILTFIE